MRPRRGPNPPPSSVWVVNQAGRLLLLPVGSKAWETCLRSGQWQYVDPPQPGYRPAWHPNRKPARWDAEAQRWKTLVPPPQPGPRRRVSPAIELGAP